MKTTVDSDLMLDATEEAKICLYCDKKQCKPNCERLKKKKAELKREKKRKCLKG